MTRRIPSLLVMFLFSLLFLPACENPPPTVTEITPVYGLTRGGEQVVVRGESLASLAPLHVYFGNNRVLTSGFNGAGEFWVTLPPAEKGVVDVRIIGADGTEFLIDDGFEYVRTDKMAKCVNIGKALNGQEVNAENFE